MSEQDQNANARQFFNIASGLSLSKTPLGGWGFLVGATIGALLFPPKYKRPDKYTELQINSAQTNIPIPLLYGTMRMGGNYIWRGDLTAVAVKSSGGSSGTKRVSGYKYYMNSAIGFCSGEAYVTRMWANDDMVRLDTDSSVTIYEGLTDQTTDPLISTNVDNPVPYRGLCYGVFDDYYLGQDTAQAPVMTVEAHRYPYDSNGGGSARVYTYVNSIRDTDDGFTVKMMDGKIVTMSATEIRVYDKEFTAVEKTIDISGIIGVGANQIYDVKYKQGTGDFLFVLYKDTGLGRLKLMAIAINEYSDGATIASAGNTWSRTIESGNAYRRGAIAFTKDYCYVAYKYGISGGGAGDTIKVRQYNIAPFLQNQRLGSPSWIHNDSIATFDISGSIARGIGGDSLGLDATEDIALISAWDRIYSFDLPTFSLQDSLDMSAKTGNINSLAWLKGGDEVVFVVPSANDSYLEVVGFDKDGGGLVLRDEINLSEFWETTPTWGLNYDFVRFNPDGTLLISYPYGEGIQYVIMDANPSQIFYDAFVVQRDVSPSRIDTTSLQVLSDYCRDNYIGLSLLLNAQIKTSEFLQNLLSYIHGIIFINNDGKYEFKIYRNTDASQATIGNDDLSRREFEKVEVSLKDRDLIPNRLDIKYTDRLYDYKESSFQADNFLAQDEDGEIISTQIDYKYISNVRTASQQGYKAMKFARYDTKIFSFYLLPKFLYLVVGDVVTLNLPLEQLNNQKVRIISLDEPAVSRGGDLNVIARLEADYLNTFGTYNTSATRKVSASAPLPTPVQPIVFEQPALFNNDMNTLCIAYIRTDNAPVGVDVHVAEEDLNYTFIDSIPKPALPGVLHRAMGDQFEDKIIYINTSDYVDPYATFTVVEQRKDRSFSLVGVLADNDIELTNLEFVTYRDVEQQGNIAKLERCYRGKYYTIPKTHAIGETMIDVEYGRYLAYQYPDDMVGKIIYIRCLSKNISGEVQDFDNVKTYSYTLQGYTRKATHVSGLELRLSGVGLGGSDTTTDTEPELIWLDTNRVGGMSSLGFNEWLENRIFLEGDITGYNLHFYDSGGVFKATRTIGDVQEFIYSIANQTTDFGAPPSEYYTEVEPFNANGSVLDRVRKHIVKI